VSQTKRSTEARLSRRGALKVGAAIGASGAALAVSPATVARTNPVDQATVSWRQETFDYDFMPVDPVSIVRAGEGPPQRGDFFHVNAAIFAMGDAGHNQIGEYECFGVWTRPSTDTTSRSTRLTTVHFNIWGQGALMGIVNEGGPVSAELEGAIQGGTGRHAGALGTFRQTTINQTPLTVRASFRVLAPNLG
jgi:hypothetical protein